MMVSSAVTPRASESVSRVYPWRQRLGRNKGVKLFELQLKLHFFVRGIIRWQIIEFDCDLLWLGINTESLLTQLLQDYHLQPDRLLIVSHYGEHWETMRFGQWDGKKLSCPVHEPLHPRTGENILTGAIIPINRFAHPKKSPASVTDARLKQNAVSI